MGKELTFLKKKIPVPVINQKAETLPKPKRGVGYPKEYKVKILMLLKANEYNILKTAEQTGLPYNSIKNWRNELGVEVFREDERITTDIARDELKTTVANAKKEMQDITTSIYENATHAEKELIDRIRVVAKTSTNLDHLSRCLKVIHEITCGNPDEDKETHDISKSQSSYYNIIMNNIINIEEDIKWKLQREAKERNQSKSLPPSHSPA